MTDVSRCGGRGAQKPPSSPVLNTDRLLLLDFALPEKPDESSIFCSFTFILFICKCPFRPLLFSVNMGIKCTAEMKTCRIFTRTGGFSKPLHYVEVVFFSVPPPSPLMCERARYPDRHVCNREKGFDVFLQAAGKVPLS